jgi:hypothetical protein
VRVDIRRERVPIDACFVVDHVQTSADARHGKMQVFPRSAASVETVANDRAGASVTTSADLARKEMRVVDQVVVPYGDPFGTPVDPEV